MFLLVRIILNNDNLQLCEYKDMTKINEHNPFFNVNSSKIYKCTFVVLGIN